VTLGDELTKPDGQRPLVAKTGRGRSWIARYVGGVTKPSPNDLASTDKNSIATHYRGPVPARARARRLRVAKLRQWYADNEEYFGPGQDQWRCAIDADLTAAKPSNRKPEFLDWLPACPSSATSCAACASRRSIPPHASAAARLCTTLAPGAGIPRDTSLLRL
jgi:hypothetical protein